MPAFAWLWPESLEQPVSLLIDIDELNPQLSSESSQRHWMKTLIEQAVKQKKQVIIHFKARPSMDTMRAIKALVEKCPHFVGLQQEHISPELAAVVLPVLARNLYLWQCDSEMILEEVSPQNVDWWQRTMFYWASQVSLKHQNALFYYKQLTHFDGERYLRGELQSANNLLIELAGPAFFEACLCYIDMKGCAASTFVLNANVVSSRDEANNLKADHISLDYLELLGKFAPSIPFSAMRLEGIHPKRIHLGEYEREHPFVRNHLIYPELERDYLTRMPKVLADMSRWVQQQRCLSSVMPDVEYKLAFLENLVVFLEAAPRTLTTLTLQALETNCPVFNETELQQLIARARDGKITTFLIDDARAAYSEIGQAYLLELENIIAVNRKNTLKNMPMHMPKIDEVDTTRTRATRTRQRQLELHLQRDQAQSLAEEHEQEQAFLPSIKPMNVAECLNLRKFLLSIYYRQHHMSFGNGHLLDAWSAVFGRHREAFGQFYITPRAAQEIFTHFSYFQDGFCFSHPPQGFFMAPGDPDGEVLCFDPKRLSDVACSPLVVRFNNPRALSVQLWGTVKQFGVDRLVSLNALFISQAQFESEREFLYEILQNNGLIALKPWITSPSNARAILYLLQNHQLETVAQLLSQLSALGAHFKRAFLDNSEDWTLFLTPSYQLVLTQLQRQTASRRSWWEALTLQHMAHQPEAQLDQLWAAFDYFVEEFERIMGQELPAVCIWNDVKYMPTRLLVFLDYLYHHPAPQDSSEEWARLDYTPTGFSYALAHDGYHWVDARMALTPVLSDVDAQYYQWERYMSIQHVQELPVIPEDPWFRTTRDQFYLVNNKEFFYIGPDGKQLIVIPIKDWPLFLEGIGRKYQITQAVFHRLVLQNCEKMSAEDLHVVCNPNYGTFSYKIAGLTVRVERGGQSHEYLSPTVPGRPNVSYKITAEYCLNESISLPEVLPYWYRYLGTRKHHASIQAYQDAEAWLTSVSYSDVVKKSFLYLIALATTHQRGILCLNREVLRACVDLILDQASYLGLLEQWKDQNPNLREWAMLYQLYKRGINLHEFHVYGTDFLMALSAIRESQISEFLSSLDDIHRAELSVSNKQTLLRLPFIALPAAEMRHLIRHFQTSAGHFNIAHTITMMSIEWHTGRMPEKAADWIEIFKQWDDKTVDDRKHLILQALGIVAGESESSIHSYAVLNASMSFEEWCAVFRARHGLMDGALLSLEARKASNCLQQFESIAQVEYLKDPLTRLLTQYDYALSKWSIHLMLSILSRLQQIASGPPRQEYPFSLLDALVKDSFWSRYTLETQQVSIFVDVMQDILVEFCSKADKIAQLSLALRLAALGLNTIDIGQRLKQIRQPYLKLFAQRFRTIPLEQFDGLLQASLALCAQATCSIEEIQSLLAQAYTPEYFAECLHYLFSLSASPEKQAILIGMMGILTDFSIADYQKLTCIELPILIHMYLLLQLGVLNSGQLFSLLELQDQQQLEQALIVHERDPRQCRASLQNINIREREVIEHIEYLTEHGLTRLSYAHRLTLIQQINLINQMGNSRAIPGADGQVYSCAAELSMHDLRTLIVGHREILNDSTVRSEKREASWLILLALAREVMFRTWKMPNSTQIIAVLCARLLGGNLFMQIIAGEGKTAVLALQAAMDSLLGLTVDICTRNEALASRDLQLFNQFFKFLNCSTDYLTSMSPESSYQQTTLYYSDVGQRGLLEARFSLLSPIYTERHPTLANRKYLLDEADTVLDEVTHFRETTIIGSLEQAGAGIYQDVQWLYDTVNTYLLSHGIETQSQINVDDIAELRSCLLAQAGSYEFRIAQLQDISDKQLEIWLYAAQTAMKLVENKDFLCGVTYRICDEERIPYSIAYILDPVTHRVLQGPQWSKGVQQLLHSRLERERRAAGIKTPRFLIEPEVTPLTALGLTDVLARAGAIFGVTGTLGDEAEMLELSKRYSAAMVRMPTHLENRLNIHASICAGSTAEYLHEIYSQVQMAIRKTPAQPVLIHVKTRVESDTIYQYLMSNLTGLQIQTVHAQEVMEHNEEEMIRAAGRTGMVTISSIFNRGTDIPVQHSDGLLSIVTDADDIRECEQGFRRSGRYGAPGQAILIVNREKLSEEAKGEMNAESALTIHRRTLFHYHASERYFREQENRLRHYFFAWFIRCRHAIPLELIDQLRNGKMGLDALWAHFMKEMDEAFSKRRELLSATYTKEQFFVDHVQETIQFWQDLWLNFSNMAHQQNCLVRVMDGRIIIEEHGSESPELINWAFVPFTLSDEHSIHEHLRESSPILGEAGTDLAVPVLETVDDWYSELLQQFVGPVETNRSDTEILDKINAIWPEYLRPFTMTQIFEALLNQSPNISWHSISKAIAVGSEEIKRQYRVQYEHYLRACLDEHVLAKRSMNKPRFEDAFLRFQEARICHAFDLVDWSDFELNNWHAAFHVVQNLIQDYRNTWFKSADRKRDLQTLQDALNTLDSEQPQWTQLLQWIDATKRTVAQRDLQHDQHWFFGLKRRNIQGSRFQTALELALDAVQTYAGCQLSTDSHEFTQACYTSIHTQIQSLRERLSWDHQADDLLTLLTQFPAYPTATGSLSIEQAWIKFSVNLQHFTEQFNQLVPVKALQQNYDELQKRCQQLLSYLPSLDIHLRLMQQLQEGCQACLPRIVTIEQKKTGNTRSGLIEANIVAELQHQLKSLFSRADYPQLTLTVNCMTDKQYKIVIEGWVEQKRIEVFIARDGNGQFTAPRLDAVIDCDSHIAQPAFI